MDITPPVFNGPFLHAGDGFFVKSSGDHLHSRATPFELQTIFQPASSGSYKFADRVGHWYEAQLIHFGIPPSKTKSVAKMRLLDAYKDGNLTVPKEILKIEASLKKKWSRNDKKAREASGKQEPESSQRSHDSAKRKRSKGEDEVHEAPQSSKKKKKSKSKDDSRETANGANGSKHDSKSKSKESKSSEKRFKASGSKSDKTTKADTEPRQLPRGPGKHEKSRHDYKGRNKTSSSHSNHVSKEISEPQTSETSDSDSDESSSSDTDSFPEISTPKPIDPVSDSVNRPEPSRERWTQGWTPRWTPNMGDSRPVKTVIAPAGPSSMFQSARRGGSAFAGKVANNTHAVAATGTPDAGPPSIRQTTRCSRGGASVGGRRSLSKEGNDMRHGPAYSPSPFSGRRPSVTKSGIHYTPGGRQIQVTGESEPLRDDAGFGSPRQVNSSGYRGHYQRNDQRDYQADPGHAIEDHPARRNPKNLRPGGKINGLYEVESEGFGPLEENSTRRFTLDLCVAGKPIWGAYDFGVHHGILYMPDRPHNASAEKLPFYWRGRGGKDGQMSFGPQNMGWVRFLGDGLIEGMTDFSREITFHGRRIPSQGSCRSVRSMREEWNGYNEEQFEHERRSRPVG